MGEAPDPYPRLPYPPSAPFIQRLCEAEHWIIFLMNSLNCESQPEPEACRQAAWETYRDNRNACPAE